MANGMSRRQFVERSARLAVRRAERLDPVGMWERRGQRRIGGGDTIPLARLDNPVTLPDNGSEPVAGGQSPSGTLRVLNYADYINPETQAAFEQEMGTKIEITVYDTRTSCSPTSQRLADLRPRDGRHDAPTPEVRGRRPDPAAQPQYLTNFDNVLDSLQSPYYDVGKYTLRRLRPASRTGGTSSTTAPSPATTAGSCSGIRPTRAMSASSTTLERR